jgi:hypothetical protein
MTVTITRSPIPKKNDTPPGESHGAARSRERGRAPCRVSVGTPGRPMPKPPMASRRGTSKSTANVVRQDSLLLATPPPFGCAGAALAPRPPHTGSSPVRTTSGSHVDCLTIASRQGAIHSQACRQGPSGPRSGRLTLRAGSSSAGSRFITPANAGTPRRRCPRHVHRPRHHVVRLAAEWSEGALLKRLPSRV